MGRSLADEPALDAVLTASRSMVAVATRPLRAAAEVPDCRWPLPPEHGPLPPDMLAEPEGPVREPVPAEASGQR
jgi:hypothetical protein